MSPLARLVLRLRLARLSRQLHRLRRDTAALRAQLARTIAQGRP